MHRPPHRQAAHLVARSRARFKQRLGGPPVVPGHVLDVAAEHLRARNSAAAREAARSTSFQARAEATHVLSTCARPATVRPLPARGTFCDEARRREPLRH